MRARNLKLKKKMPKSKGQLLVHTLSENKSIQNQSIETQTTVLIAQMPKKKLKTKQAKTFKAKVGVVKEEKATEKFITSISKLVEALDTVSFFSVATVFLTTLNQIDATILIDSKATAALETLKTKIKSYTEEKCKLLSNIKDPLRLTENIDNMLHANYVLLALANNPSEETQINMQIAGLLVCKSAWEPALHIYAKIIDRSEKKSDARYNAILKHAEILLFLDKKAEALVDLHHALAIQPGNVKLSESITQLKMKIQYENFLSISGITENHIHFIFLLLQEFPHLILFGGAASAILEHRSTKDVDLRICVDNIDSSLKVLVNEFKFELTRSTIIRGISRFYNLKKTFTDSPIEIELTLGRSSGPYAYAGCESIVPYSMLQFKFMAPENEKDSELKLKISEIHQGIYPLGPGRFAGQLKSDYYLDAEASHQKEYGFWLFPIATHHRGFYALVEKYHEKMLKHGLDEKDMLKVAEKPSLTNPKVKLYSYGAILQQMSKDFETKILGTEEERRKCFLELHKLIKERTAGIHSSNILPHLQAFFSNLVLLHKKSIPASQVKIIVDYIIVALKNTFNTGIPPVAEIFIDQCFYITKTCIQQGFTHEYKEVDEYFKTLQINVDPRLFSSPQKTSITNTIPGLLSGSQATFDSLAQSPTKISPTNPSGSTPTYASTSTLFSSLSTTKTDKVTAIASKLSA